MALATLGQRKIREPRVLAREAPGRLAVPSQIHDRKRLAHASPGRCASVVTARLRIFARGASEASTVAEVGHGAARSFARRGMTQHRGPPTQACGCCHLAWMCRTSEVVQRRSASVGAALATLAVFCLGSASSSSALSITDIGAQGAAGSDEPSGTPVAIRARRGRTRSPKRTPRIRPTSRSRGEGLAVAVDRLALFGSPIDAAGGAGGAGGGATARSDDDAGPHQPEHRTLCWRGGVRRQWRSGRTRHRDGSRR